MLYGAPIINVARFDSQSVLAGGSDEWDEKDLKSFLNLLIHNLKEKPGIIDLKHAKVIGLFSENSGIR
jgi:hypothetical protein